MWVPQVAPKWGLHAHVWLRYGGWADESVTFTREISPRALRDAVSRPHESWRARECAAHCTVLVRRQTAHPFVHSERERAVNRLPPPASRHGDLLAHEPTVELSPLTARTGTRITLESRSAL
eukprot:802683-Prymnesium_polylepis.1